MQHRKPIVALLAILLALGAFSSSSAGVLFVEEADDPGVGADVAGSATYAVAVTYTVPLTAGWNLVSLGGNSAGEDISVVLAGIISDVLKVIGFETPAINPNPAGGVGGKYYSPTLPIVSTLANTDPRLGYWIYMNAAQSLEVSPPAKVVARGDDAFPAGGRLHPVYDFMGIHGSLTIADEPAPLGTLVEVYDGEGNLAGMTEVRHPGVYGFLPIYRDNLSSPVDEGADTGEWLTVHVNGRSTAQQVQWTAFGDAVEVDLALRALPTEFALQQNYPNPFNPSTTISYQLVGEEEVRLSIWNSVGQRVRELVHSTQPAGFYAATWDGRDDAGRSLADGVYFAQLEAGDFLSTQKMVLLK